MKAKQNTVLVKIKIVKRLDILSEDDLKQHFALRGMTITISILYNT